MSAARIAAADLSAMDHMRLEANSRLNPGRKTEFGQFMTPGSVARFMASLFSERSGFVRLLDAGAGVGSLTAAFVSRFESREMSVAAYEIDSTLPSTCGRHWRDTAAASILR